MVEQCECTCANCQGCTGTPLPEPNFYPADKVCSPDRCVSPVACMAPKCYSSAKLPLLPAVEGRLAQQADEREKRTCRFCNRPIFRFASGRVWTRARWRRNRASRCRFVRRTIITYR